MKQYTDKNQTAKLLELGFPEPSPKYIHIGGVSYDSNHNYSIGELIEFLPPKIEWEGIVYSRVIDIESIVYYSWNYEIYFGSDLIFETKELIDSLFKACVTLKEGGVI